MICADVWPPSFFAFSATRAFFRERNRRRDDGSCGAAERDEERDCRDPERRARPLDP